MSAVIEKSATARDLVACVLLEPQECNKIRGGDRPRGDLVAEWLLTPPMRNEIANGPAPASHLVADLWPGQPKRNKIQARVSA
jgi:hypothetical protein